MPNRQMFVMFALGNTVTDACFRFAPREELCLRCFCTCKDGSTLWVRELG